MFHTPKIRQGIQCYVLNYRNDEEVDLFNYHDWIYTAQGHFHFLLPR